MRLPTLTKISQRLFQSRLRRVGVSIAPGCYVARGSDVSSHVTFGRGTRVNGPGVFKGSEPIHVGNYCAIGDGVRMISSNHRTDFVNLQGELQQRLGLEFKTIGDPIVIGHNVWVGDAAIILSGVNVGTGAIIGAGSVVNDDVPPFAVVAGVPARLIRMRFTDKEIARQLKLAWWHWPEARMRENLHLFAVPVDD
jgi:virginiamycin A acetyltransferase